MKLQNRLVAVACAAALVLTPVPALAADGSSVSNDSSRAVLVSDPIGSTYSADDVLEQEWWSAQAWVHRLVNA